jgi:hypothetical protein
MYSENLIQWVTSYIVDNEYHLLLPEASTDHRTTTLRRSREKLQAQPGSFKFTISHFMEFG